MVIRGALPGAPQLTPPASWTRTVGSGRRSTLWRGAHARGRPLTRSSPRGHPPLQRPIPLARGCPSGHPREERLDAKERLRWRRAACSAPPISPPQDTILSRPRGHLLLEGYKQRGRVHFPKGTPKGTPKDTPKGTPTDTFKGTPTSTAKSGVAGATTGAVTGAVAADAAAPQPPILTKQHSQHDVLTVATEEEVPPPPNPDS